MVYDPHPEKLRQVRAYFEAQQEAPIEELLAALEGFAAAPDIPKAAALLKAYFAQHRRGDLRSLRMIASAFADKRTTLALVRSALEDRALLGAIARRSYPHPIGFDKLVLHDHLEGGPEQRFKLRLHIYWRSPQELNTELIHLHRFEMASSPITGELTNHLYRTAPIEGVEPLRCFAYTGYERDPQGVLHKRCLGERALWLKGQRTFVPGQTYAQRLEHAHFVETNAETGHTNGDVCSTIYIHGPGLTDGDGRKIPILYAPARVPDEIITPIAPLTEARLTASLERYARLLSESLSFYDWLYDERYGRNLSVGMIAGYLLSEAFQTTRTIEMWERHRAACEDVLRARSEKLRTLVLKGAKASALPGEDRDTRYFQSLLNKSYDHPEGPRRWLELYGDLSKELERYLGALLGDYAKNPQLKVLKPIWDLDAARLSGGAHYGRVWTLLEAARAASPEVMLRFRTEDLRSREKAGEGPVTEVDLQVERRVRALLLEHFPETPAVGEEEGATELAPPARWLIDPIDGTRNFICGNKNFAISLAHQRRVGEAYQTTDAVVALPAHGELYWAEREKGAFRINHEGKETRLRVPGGAQEALSGALVDLSVRGLGAGAMALEQALVEAGAVRRATGCAALMLAMVSGSGNDGAIVTANEYDVAAGALVAEEAGAVVSKVTFERAGRGFVAYVAAQTKALHDALRGMVEGAIDRG